MEPKARRRGHTRYEGQDYRWVAASRAGTGSRRAGAYVKAAPPVPPSNHPVAARFTYDAGDACAKARPQAASRTDLRDDGLVAEPTAADSHTHEQRLIISVARAVSKSSGRPIRVGTWLPSPLHHRHRCVSSEERPYPYLKPPRPRTLRSGCHPTRSAYGSDGGSGDGGWIPSRTKATYFFCQRLSPQVSRRSGALSPGSVKDAMRRSPVLGTIMSAPCVRSIGGRSVPEMRHGSGHRIPVNRYRPRRICLPDASEVVQAGAGACPVRHGAGTTDGHCRGGTRSRAGRYGQRFWVALGPAAIVFSVNAMSMSLTIPAINIFCRIPNRPGCGSCSGSPGGAVAGWPFFQRGWASIVPQSNMFTLIAIGTGTTLSLQRHRHLFPFRFPNPSISKAARCRCISKRQR